MSAENPGSSVALKPGINDPDSVDGQKGKKALRGSRQVKKLSAEQLARKRAHDREAQRNSRKRTIEHIEQLEKTVGDHVDYNRQLLAQNEQLELRLARLESQLHSKPGFASTSTAVPEFPVAVESLVPLKPLYASEVDDPSRSTWDASSQASSMAPSMALHSSSYAQASAGPTALSIPAFDLGMAPGPTIYNPSPQTSFEGPTYNTVPKADYDEEFDAEFYNHDNLSNPAAVVPSFYMADSTTTQSSSLAPTFPNNPINNSPPLGFVPLCWQRQPSVYAWQMSTKLCTPDNPTDELILSIVQSQRHQARTSNLCGEALVGPKIPSLNALFDRSGGETSHPLVAALTNGVLQLRQFITTPPNLICGLLATYRLYQWMIEPTQETYNRLFEWQAPRPSQLLISHPAWMDLPPWGKFRDRIIENQDLYDNLEFQLAYMANMNIIWPYDSRDMFCINDDGQLRPSQLLEKHLSSRDYMVMRKPFATRYPEFHDLCRFEEDDT